MSLLVTDCPFCDQPIERGTSPSYYHCPRCGHIYLPIDIESKVKHRYSKQQRSAISIMLRNKWERDGQPDNTQELTLEQLELMVSQFKPLDPIEKLNQALRNLKAASKEIGTKIHIDIQKDYPYYHCNSKNELRSLLTLLHKERLIEARDPVNPHIDPELSLRGYERLSEIQSANNEPIQIANQTIFNQGDTDLVQKKWTVN